MSEILAPAIRMAREGVPEHELNAKAVGHCSYFEQVIDELRVVAGFGEADQECFAELEGVSLIPFGFMGQADEWDRMMMPDGV